MNGIWADRPGAEFTDGYIESQWQMQHHKEGSEVLNCGEQQNTFFFFPCFHCNITLEDLKGKNILGGNRQ